MTNNLSYLQDPQWLADREKKWQQLAAAWLSGESEKELVARKNYFFEGDIDKYIENVEKTSLYYVISDSPFKDVNAVIDSISKYWCWVLKAAQSREQSEQFSDINKRFNSNLHAIFSYKDDNLSPEVCIGLFFWLYGKSYRKDRTVTLKNNDCTVTIPIEIDVNEFSHNLLDGILNYLWRTDQGINICIFRSFIPYFLSLYPNMSPVFFSTVLPDQQEYISDDGKKYQLSCFIWHRWLLTTLNGYITDYEKDEDIKELICNDDEALAQLKNGLNTLKMPDEFYRLQKFVLKHKGDSLYASE